MLNSAHLRWNEWITLPIKYCDLPLNSQIAFTVWDIQGPRQAMPVGGSTFRLFGKKWYAVETNMIHINDLTQSQYATERKTSLAIMA